jgi:hypothetical protein
MKIRPSFRVFHCLVAASIAIAAGCPAMAQSLVRIDATALVPPPQPVEAKPGASVNPGGHTIQANSQYLALDGKPWLPVMGEFHFSRYPESEWETEILKMKAAGVQIVSAYVIWIHHEQTEGIFDWNGQRDLRKFVQICGRHGMYVYPRIGPWAHAEVRNGGFPDWVLKNGPTRQDDPVYLREVQTYYAQIGQQLRGLMWKDGGPVVGIQIENEYRETGPGKGAEHIRTLKRIALENGLDVPLYTVTGWDGAAIPLDAVLPVFGGYPDAPWDGSDKKLPANEVYAFRFDNRVAGSMGAIGRRGQNAAATYRGTPFLTAEVGDGIEDTYFRRPVVDPDDIASIPPVMLGSGVNLLGYYMFHGGRNPDGGDITLQESQRTGYPTDVPVKSYDFQAPLGEFGQERESLRKLKLVHYFLNDFGALLAPMAVRAPDRVPSDPTDTTVPRVAARTAGDTGFVFFNNHLRGLRMPARPGFQVELRVPSGTLRIPETPIDLASGAYGIWPVNIALRGTTLRYSTAQLFKRVDSGNESYFFFFALPGVPAEFAFDHTVQVLGTSGSVTRSRSASGIRLWPKPEAEIRIAGGVHLVLLTEAAAEEIWRGDDPSVLVAAQADAFSDGKRWTFESDGDPHISFGIFGPNVAPYSHNATVRSEAKRGLFRRFASTLSPLDLSAKVTEVRAATARAPWTTGPKVSWRTHQIPLAPDDADFEAASVWRIDVPATPESSAVADTLLRIDYQGDVARLYMGGQLLDDNFWNGSAWEVGLKEVNAEWRSPRTLELRVLPLPRQFPMYLEKAGDLHFGSSDTANAVTSVRLVTRYRLDLDIPSAK